MKKKQSSGNESIVLLYPPQATPTNPYSSLPVLTGFLRNKGFKVIQRDLNIEIFDSLLTKKMLKEMAENGKNRYSESILPFDKKYKIKYEDISDFFEYVIENIDCAKKILRTKKLFLNLKDYHWAISIIYLACEIISLPFFPTKLSPSRYESDTSPTLKDLIMVTSRKTDNVFYDFFEKYIVNDIIRQNPLLIGISISFESQVIPGFTLARLIKQNAPDIPINIGGSIIYQMEEHIRNDPDFFIFADSYIIGEGETPLELLATSIKDSYKPRSIPNLISKNTKFNAISNHFEDIKTIPCPDYEGLDLSLYLSPEPIFFLSSTRGCYHGKCAFCDVSMNTRRRFREMGEIQFVNYIDELHKKYGAKRFFFCDDAMPPKKMLAMADYVISSNQRITWKAESRFEKNFTMEFLSKIKKGGCISLLFGFESASQRVLDLMNKKNFVKRDINILKSCDRIGIPVNIQTFIGFPTETIREAKKTIRFLIKNEKIIPSIGLTTFSLFKNTPIYQTPSQYGITSISVQDEKNLFQVYNYISDSGLTPSEAKKLVEKSLIDIRRIYSTRMYYLDLHDFLYFSYNGLQKTREMWECEERSSLYKKMDLEKCIFQVSTSVLLSNLNEKISSRYRCYHTKTGKNSYLTKNEREICSFFNGRNTVSDVVSLWLEYNNNELTDIPKLFETFKNVINLSDYGIIEKINSTNNHNPIEASIIALPPVRATSTTISSM